MEKLRREDAPFPAPNTEGNVWPKQVCLAFEPRADTPEEPVRDSGNQEGDSVSGNMTVATTGSAIETETNGQQEPPAPEWEETTVDIPVTWTAEPEYDENENGDYVFTPVIEGYTVSADLPKIIVTVGAQPRIMALRGGTPTTYGDFSVSIEEAGAVPTFYDGSKRILRRAVRRRVERDHPKSLRLRHDRGDRTKRLTVHRRHFRQP